MDQEYGQGAATMAAQAGAERSLLCNTLKDPRRTPKTKLSRSLVVGKGWTGVRCRDEVGGQAPSLGPGPEPRVVLGTWPERSTQTFVYLTAGIQNVSGAAAALPMTRDVSLRCDLPRPCWDPGV